ncbi:unnamed protein product [Acanthoscelides obtectus]|uniref:Uncharacterized protein n=1 Tax=Acanthoscelides obtectus TaxID=200917 RepID=A0A9P0LD36_ACAOB|nr:unnamed protein product [Acanthoscelides obtectus]CAK1620797.1 hypothetical protein AOBTE_LOCUS575 [Acanthoscelides obtectus]
MYYKVFPSVNNQKGIVANAAMVLIAVATMDNPTLPPSKRVHRFEAPPPGEAPVNKRPNC